MSLVQVRSRGCLRGFAPAVASLEITLTAVYSWRVRTNFLEDNSMRFVEEPIADYAGFAGAVRGRRAMDMRGATLVVPAPAHRPTDRLVRRAIVGPLR